MTIADSGHRAVVTGNPADGGAFRLNLLGAFQLTAGDGVVLLPPGKPLALLTYLVCSRNRRASRSVVADLLWGDSAESQRRASLRQALFTLRNAVGSEAVVSDGEWLEAGAGIVVDVDAFLLAIESRQYAGAVSAYRGDFLPNFAAPGAAEFERWADTERLRLRGAFLATAVQHLRDLIAKGDTARALPLTQRLVELSPDDDEMWRRRFDVLSLAGEGGQMLLEVASLRAARNEDGIALDPSLERHIGQLVGSLARHATPASDEPEPVGIPVMPEFQGRSDAFTALLAAWAAASAGAPQRFLVVGAPGMGKSRLLRELTKRVTQRRVQVVLVSAQQRERDDAFALLAELVSKLVSLPGAAGMAPSSAAVLAALVPRIGEEFSVTPEATTTGSADLLLRRLRALADLIGAVAEENPLLLLLDDVHWADDSSIKVIDHALQRVNKACVLMVATSRHDAPELGCGESGIVLRPLDRNEVQALIASIADIPAANVAFVDAIHAAAHGSPFEVLQLLREALSSEVLRMSDRSWVVNSESGLQDLCREARTPHGRLRDIGDGEREALSLLAVLDAPMEESLLLALLDEASTQATLVLGDLERDGLAVRDPSRRWSIAHALIADDIRSTLTTEQQQRSARRVGAALLKGAREFAAIRRAVRLLLEGGDVDAALDGVVRWYVAQGRSAPAIDDLVLSLRGTRQHVEFELALRRRLRWRRAWWRQPAVVAACSVAVTLAAIGWYLTRPARLVIISEMDPAFVLDAEIPFEVPPRIEVQNHLGWRSTARDGDTLRVIAEGKNTRLRGRTFAVLRDGVAEFDSLYPLATSTPSPVPAILKERSASRDTVYPLFEYVAGIMRVELSGVPPLALPAAASRDELRVVEYLLNGKLVRDSTGTVRVTPGARIAGNVRLRYTTRGRSLLYVLAQTTTWREPREDTTTVRSLLAGVSGARVSVPIDLTAPSREGDYWILFTQGAEPAAIWLLSGTNWRCQQPRWDDGNDLASQPSGFLEDGVRTGEVPLPFDYCDPPEYRQRRSVALAGIRVEVRR